MAPDQNQEGAGNFQFWDETFDKYGYLVEDNEKLHEWSLANVQKKGFDYRRNIKEPCRRIRVYHKARHVYETYLGFDPLGLDTLLCYRCEAVVQLSTYEKQPKSCLCVKFMNKVTDFSTVELPVSTIDVPRGGKYNNSSESVSEDDSDSDDSSESESGSEDGGISAVNGRKRKPSAKKKKTGQKRSKRLRTRSEIKG